MTLPNNLTNGTQADADKVMENFNFLDQTPETVRYASVHTGDQTFSTTEETIWGLSYSNNIKITPVKCGKVKFELSTLLYKDIKSYYLYLYLYYKINGGTEVKVDMIPYTENGHLAYVDRHFIDVGVGNELSIQVRAKKQSGGSGTTVQLPSYAYKLVTLQEL